jgi:hypothetical protein
MNMKLRFPAFAGMTKRAAGMTKRAARMTRRTAGMTRRTAGMTKRTGIRFALVKPQFEVGKGEVGKHGVVRDPALHERVVSEIETFCRELGLDVLEHCESPITGPEGNREFFVYLKKSAGITIAVEAEISE